MGMRASAAERAAMAEAHTTRMTGAMAARTASVARNASAACTAGAPPSMSPSQIRNAETHRDPEREFPDRFHDLIGRGQAKNSCKKIGEQYLRLIRPGRTI